MSKTIFYIILLLVLIIGFIIFLFTKRNFFNKYKFIRIVQYNNDMTITVKYIKRDQFNVDNKILVNSKHIFNFTGYKSIIITSEANESINPLDFESKYSAKDYQTAIKSKIISEAFASLKEDKFDKVMALIMLNVIQLIAIAYLLYNVLGGTTS